LTPGQHSLTGPVRRGRGQRRWPVERSHRDRQPDSHGTTIASSNSSVNVGTPVTFTATVSNASGPEPTGTVQFTDGATVLGNATVDSNGHAALHDPGLAPRHAPTSPQPYSGDTDNSARLLRARLVETIQQIPTTTILTSDLNPAGRARQYPPPRRLPSRQPPLPDGAIAGGRSPSVKAPHSRHGPGQLSGVATIAVSTLAVGLHNIVRHLSRQHKLRRHHLPTSSPRPSHPPQPTSVAHCRQHDHFFGQAGHPHRPRCPAPPAFLRATSSFQDGGANIGQGTLNAQGVATLSTSSLSVGSHTLTVVYQGNGSYTASTSASLVGPSALAAAGLTLATPASPMDVGTR